MLLTSMIKRTDGKETLQGCRHITWSFKVELEHEHEHEHELKLKLDLKLEHKFKHELELDIPRVVYLTTYLPRYVILSVTSSH